MRISCVNNCNPNFKSYNSYDSNNHNWGSDISDNESSRVRDLIRERMYSRIISAPETVDSLPSYAHDIEDVFLKNFRKLGYNAYCGETLNSKPAYLDLLKPSGVDTVIDLVGYYNLEEACQDKELNYYKYPVNLGYWSHPIFVDNETLIKNKKNELYKESLTKKEFDEKLNDHIQYIRDARAEFLEDFTKLAQIIKDGHFYLACEYGEDRTPNILAMNSYFNPQWHGANTKPTSKYPYNAMKNMYFNLSDSDKKQLGITEDYDNKLREEFEQ